MRLVSTACSCLVGTALVEAAQTLPPLGSYTTTINEVLLKSPIYSSMNMYNILANTLQNSFWNATTGNWIDSCQKGGPPDLWQVTVAGRAVTPVAKNVSNAVNAIRKYRNTATNGYSATVARDTDMYSDDDAQALWVFLDVLATGKGDLSLQSDISKLYNFISAQKNSTSGGITWKFHGKYVASISTLEMALAAVKSYQAGGGQSHLEFSKYCLSWTLANLLDPTDHFFFDGIGGDGKVDKSKFTYTIGVAISTMARLHTVDATEDWRAKAVELGVRSMNAGKFNTIFYSKGYIKDGLAFAELYYSGLSDLISMTSPSGRYQQLAYILFKDELIRESRHLYDSVSDREVISFSCLRANQTGYASLLDFAALTSIFHKISTVVATI